MRKTLTLLLRDLFVHPNYNPQNVLPETSLIDSYIWLPLKVEQIIAYTLLYLTTVLIKWTIIIPIRVLTRRAHTPDILALTTTIITLFLLRNVDTSKIYHTIRSSTIVKLYFMIQVLEVADKLLTITSFEILTPLYSNSSPSLLLLPPALLYLFLHSYITLYQIISLNIAINSYSNALLTVILSNHFSRLKSVIFKKLKQDDLPRLIKHDASLRFSLLISLLIVLARNALQAGSTGASHAAQLAVLTIISQSLVDALKHLYIAKLNNFNLSSHDEIHANLASVYKRSKGLQSEYNTKSLDYNLGVSMQVIVIGVYKLLVFPGVKEVVCWIDCWWKLMVGLVGFGGVVFGLLVVRVWGVVLLDKWGKVSEVSEHSDSCVNERKERTEPSEHMSEHSDSCVNGRKEPSEHSVSCVNGHKRILSDHSDSVNEQKRIDGIHNDSMNKPKSIHSDHNDSTNRQNIIQTHSNKQNITPTHNDQHPHTKQVKTIHNSYTINQHTPTQHSQTTYSPYLHNQFLKQKQL